MTHAESQGSLAAYAAGTLLDDNAERIRQHLLLCEQCRQDVYRYAVGLPRTEAVSVPHRARFAAIGVTAALAGAAVPTIAMLGVRVRDAAHVLALSERRHAGAIAECGARVEDADGRAREAAARLSTSEAARHEAERTRAAAEADRDAIDGARRAEAADASAERARLEAALAAAEAQRTRVPEPVARLPRRTVAESAVTRDALEALVAAPGVRVLPLEAAARFARVRGHVVWRQGIDEARLFVFGLPLSTGREGYRVQVRGVRGTVETPLEGIAGRPDLGVPIPVPGTIAEVVVVREETGETVLHGGR